MVLSNRMMRWTCYHVFTSLAQKIVLCTPQIRCGLVKMKRAAQNVYHVQQSLKRWNCTIEMIFNGCSDFDDIFEVFMLPENITFSTKFWTFLVLTFLNKEFLECFSTFRINTTINIHYYRQYLYWQCLFVTEMAQLWISCRYFTFVDTLLFRFTFVKSNQMVKCHIQSKICFHYISVSFFRCFAKSCLLVAETLILSDFLLQHFQLLWFGNTGKPMVSITKAIFNGIFVLNTKTFFGNDIRKWKCFKLLDRHFDSSISFIDFISIQTESFPLELNPIFGRKERRYNKYEAIPKSRFMR